MEQRMFPFSALVHPCARVAGRVMIGERSSVWAHAVVCGVLALVRIGEETNIQESCCIVTIRAGRGIAIGNRVTIGRSAALLGCTIEDECLIRTGAVILSGAHISRGSIVGARSVVPAGMKVPPNTLVTGVPARIRRTVTAAEHQRILDTASEEIRAIDKCREDFRAMSRRYYLAEQARQSQSDQASAGGTIRKGAKHDRTAPRRT